MTETDPFKIVIIDKEEPFRTQVSNAFRSLNAIPIEVYSYTSLLISEIKGAYCVMIDARLVKDAKNFIEIFHALSIPKIVLVTPQIDHDSASTVIAMGSVAFYRFSPITALFPKIFDDFYQGVNQTFRPYMESLRPKLPKIAQAINAKKGKLILFHSAKGGVGCTSTLINCGLLYAQKGLKVLLLDFAGNTLRASFQQTTPYLGLQRIFSETKTGIDISTLKQRIEQHISTHSFSKYTVDLLFVDTLLGIYQTQSSSIELLFQALSTTDYDAVLIDTTSGISLQNIALWQIADEIISVTSLHIPSIFATLQQSELFHYLQLISKCSLVVNKSDSENTLIFTELQNSLSYKILDPIPFQPQLSKLENTYNFTALDPNGPYCIHYKKIAQQIIPVFASDDMAPVQKKSFVNWLKILLPKK